MEERRQRLAVVENLIIESELGRERAENLKRDNEMTAIPELLTYLHQRSISLPPVTDPKSLLVA